MKPPSQIIVRATQGIGITSDMEEKNETASIPSYCYPQQSSMATHLQCHAILPPMIMPHDSWKAYTPSNDLSRTLQVISILYYNRQQ
jgi:hypothetical protein